VDQCYFIFHVVVFFPSCRSLKPLVYIASYISWSWNHQLVSCLHMLFKPAKKTCDLAMYLCGHSQLRLFKCSGLLYKRYLYVYLYTLLWFEFVWDFNWKPFCTHIIPFIITWNRNEPKAFLYNFLLTVAHKLCLLPRHGDIKQTAWDIQPGPVKHVLAVLLFSLTSDVGQVL